MDQQLVKQQRNQSSLTVFTPRLQTLLAKVSRETKEILIARHSSLAFNEMTGEQLLTSAEFIIAELNTMTGIKVPVLEQFSRLSILIAESLKDDYPGFTIPLIQLAFKKYAVILTTGENKSYGRTLSLNDVHQVLNAFNDQLKDASDEAEKITMSEAIQNNISEQDKENRIRQNIQERFERGELQCTYADFNQLIKDGLISEASCKKVSWDAIKELKEKYLSIEVFEDKETCKGVIEKRNIDEKLALINELQDEIKGQIATLYLEWRKQNGNNIYEQL